MMSQNQSFLNVERFLTIFVSFFVDGDRCLLLICFCGDIDVVYGPQFVKRTSDILFLRCDIFLKRSFI